MILTTSQIKQVALQVLLYQGKKGTIKQLDNIMSQYNKLGYINLLKYALQRNLIKLNKENKSIVIIAKLDAKLNKS